MISLLPNMALELNAGTAVTIDSVRLKKNGNAMVYPVRQRDARVHLLRGSFCATRPAGFTEAELQIVVPAASLPHQSEVLRVGRQVAPLTIPQGAPPQHLGRTNVKVGRLAGNPRTDMRGNVSNVKACRTKLELVFNEQVASCD
ncbi:MAG TPA: hypothetical protein VK993_12920 [Chthoniobacterales bacterium]|nr:hypothetical protein [Chthoniobacterales bacterium]